MDYAITYIVLSYVVMVLVCFILAVLMYRNTGCVVITIEDVFLGGTLIIFAPCIIPAAIGVLFASAIVSLLEKHKTKIVLQIGKVHEEDSTGPV